MKDGNDNDACSLGGTTCEADGPLLASNIQAACNGKSTCKVENGKKQLKTYGLPKSCNPFLQMQYNCIRNRNPFQNKKQVKKARKQVKLNNSKEVAIGCGII